MPFRVSFQIAAGVAGTALVLAHIAQAQPLGTAFTYQGRLMDAGAPANGAYDFQLILYDAAVGGSQVGPILVLEDVVVDSGLFTVPLDFGASFGGARRWLDIGVRPGASSGTFTPLAPRQELTPTPAALYSAATPWTGVSGKPPGFADDIDNDLLTALPCGGGQVPKWNGSAWVCAADADSGGTVSSVGSGTGLTGGPITTAGTLSVVFSGSGSAGTVARSDHQHLGQSWAGANLTGLAVESTAAAGTALSGQAGAGGGYSRGVAGTSISTSGVGVYGRSTSSLGGTGIVGISDATLGLGVYAEGGEFGMRGQNSSTYGGGLFGWATGSSGLTNGVRGWTSSTGGRGVIGAALGTTGDARGVEGQSNSTAGTGVYGWATATAGGSTYGVVGRTESSIGRGVWGWTNTTDGSAVGVWGDSYSSAGRGVVGQALGVGVTYGVYGTTASSVGVGVYGLASITTGLNKGVLGETASTVGVGVRGHAMATTGSTIGLRGVSDSTSGYALYANTTAVVGTNYAIFGQAAATSAYAGYFSGRVHVSGVLTKSAGSFKIDHPLDPQHKYLYHSFVESPDMKNIYDGVIRSDADGFALVTLPDWFEALNRDFRYQLTVLGDGIWARARVFRKVTDNSFVIQTDQPWVEVSWQVTGIRQDAFAERHRIPVEEDKPDDEQGTYLYPEGFDAPRDLGLDERRTRAMSEGTP